MVLIIGVAFAQQDTSLTKEFARSSAKERNNIAKKEQSEAENDIAYQVVMTEAEALFREKRFEESLERYKQARTMRPLNVFPKVKIQDLNALIEKQVSEERNAGGSANGASIESMERSVEPVKEHKDAPVLIETPKKQGTGTVDPKMGTIDPEKVKPSGVDQKNKVGTTAVKKAETRANGSTSTPLGDGVTERFSKEGRALVCEREFTRNGKVEIYRRVIHPWGEVTYFKNGMPATERIWDETFGE